ncbi:TPA: alcohol dehydrogenase catalytic domain-containing protein [archaeon]|uniref:Alcohol dehydrogenase catalytic domain-containing protein n=1 Tax=Candidatus Naiadarchaeum limnaeum TaxID=2756139 RepID=A0A832X635_9ARCH|nr:alcohol dehydrogenase catalytic domain-containing protein [Candidatus Naiadarchaeum limnaeum]
MKAVAKTNSGKGFELIDAPTPNPKKGEVLVKIKACSVCGTDVHIYNNDPPWDTRIKTPRIIGHEFTGVVEKIGQGVKRVKVGDTVANESHIYCGNCSQCKAGRPHTCLNIKAVGIDIDGSYAEHIVVPEHVLFKVSPKLPPHIATLHESFGNSVYTVSAGPVKGKTIAVFGLGPTGLFAVAVAKHWGAKKIIAVSGTKEHIDLGKRVGAHVVVDRHNENVVERVKEETNGDGVDVFYEMAGSQGAIEQGLKVLKPGGQATLLGLPPQQVCLMWSKDVVLKDITIRAIYGREIPHTWNLMKKLFTDKKFDISPIVTHKFKLDDFEKAIEVMKSGRSGKVVMFPE